MRRRLTPPPRGAVAGRPAGDQARQHGGLVLVADLALPRAPRRGPGLSQAHTAPRYTLRTARKGRPTDAAGPSAGSARAESRPDREPPPAPTGIPVGLWRR